MGWVELAILVITIILTIVLMPNPKTESARAQGLSDVKYPTAAAGAPVALILGTARLKGPNTIFLGDFEAKPLTKTSGGGLFGGAKTTITGYDYYVGLDLGLCVGEGVTMLSIWFGKELLWTGNGTPIPGGAVYTDSHIDGINQDNSYSDTPVYVPGVNSNVGPGAIGPTIPIKSDPVTGAGNRFLIDQRWLLGGPAKQGGYSGYVTFYSGYANQQQDPYLQNVCDPNVPSYSGISHLIFEHFNWAQSPTLPEINVELQLITNGLALPNGTNVTANGWDLNPMEAIYQILTGNQYCMNLSPSLLNLPAFRACAAVLAPENLGVSVVIDSANAARDVLQEILRAAGAILYQDSSTGTITPVLIRANYNTATLPILDETIVTSMRNYTIQTWAQTFNQMRVTFNDRNAYEYGQNAATAQDFGNMGFQGRILSSNLSMPCIYDYAVAQLIAARELSIQSVPIYKIQLVCNRKAFILHPGSVFRLNWPAYGFANQVFRVQKMNLGTLLDGKITIDALQEEFATSNTTFGIPLIAANGPISKAPQPIVVFYQEECPWFVQVMNGTYPPISGVAYVQAYANAPSRLSKDMFALASRDNFATYDEVLSETPYPGTGTLVAAYNVLSNDYQDNTIGFVLTNFVNPGTLVQGATDIQKRQGFNLIVIDSEYMNFTNYVIQSDGSVMFSGIRRGLLDTQPVPHVLGARAWFVGATNVFSGNGFPAIVAISTKFLDDTGSSVFPDNRAVPQPLQLNSRADRPLPPSYLKINGTRYNGTDVLGTSTLAVTWSERLRNKTNLCWADDASEAPEAGTSYLVGYSQDLVHWTTVAASGPSATVPSIPGTMYIRVYSTLNGLLSWTAPVVAVQVQGNVIQDRSGSPILDRSGSQILWR